MGAPITSGLIAPLLVPRFQARPCLEYSFAIISPSMPDVEPQRDSEREGDTRGRSQAYDQILAQFGAESKPRNSAVEYLLSLGFSKGQARNAVYRFRQKRSLASST